MPKYDIPFSDGYTYRVDVPENTSDEAIYEAILKKHYPEEYKAYDAEKYAAREAELEESQGILATPFGSAWEGLTGYGDLPTAARLGYAVETGDEEAAAQAEQQLLESGPTGPRFTEDDVLSAWNRGEYWDAVENAFGLVGQTGGESLGYMAPYIAGAPFGVAGEVAAYGAVTGLNATNNLRRQAFERQKAREEGRPVPEWNLQDAGVAAAFQAVLDRALIHVSGINKVFKGAKPGTATETVKQAENLVEKSLTGTVGKNIAKTAAVEYPTEFLQQGAEQWQAGLDLSDPEMSAERHEAGRMALYASPMFGAPGGVMDYGANRAAIIQQKKAKEEADKIKAQLEQQKAKEQAAGQPATGIALLPGAAPNSGNTVGGATVIPGTFDDVRAANEAAVAERQRQQQEAENATRLRQLRTRDTSKFIDFPDGSRATQAQIDQTRAELKAANDVEGLKALDAALAEAKKFNKAKQKAAKSKEAAENIAAREKDLADFDANVPAGAMPEAQRVALRKKYEIALRETQKRAAPYLKEQRAKQVEALKSGEATVEQWGDVELEALGITSKATRTKLLNEGVDVSTPEGRQNLLDTVYAKATEEAGNKLVADLEAQVAADSAAIADEAVTRDIRDQQRQIEQEQLTSEARANAMQQTITDAIAEGYTAEQAARMAIEQDTRAYEAEQARTAAEQQRLREKGERAQDARNAEQPAPEKDAYMSEEPVSSQDVINEEVDNFMLGDPVFEAANKDAQKKPMVEAEKQRLKELGANWIDRFDQAMAINDPALISAVDNEAKAQLGGKLWGNLKSGLKRRRKSQATALGKEAAGVSKPKQMDMLLGVNEEQAKKQYAEAKQDEKPKATKAAKKPKPSSTTGSGQQGATAEQSAAEPSVEVADVRKPDTTKRAKTPKSAGVGSGGVSAGEGGTRAKGKPDTLTKKPTSKKTTTAKPEAKPAKAPATVEEDTVADMAETVRESLMGVLDSMKATGTYETIPGKKGKGAVKFTAKKLPADSVRLMQNVADQIEVHAQTIEDTSKPLEVREAALGKARRLTAVLSNYIKQKEFNVNTNAAKHAAADAKTTAENSENDARIAAMKAAQEKILREKDAQLDAGTDVATAVEEGDITLDEDPDAKKFDEGMDDVENFLNRVGGDKGERVMFKNAQDLIETLTKKFGKAIKTAIKAGRVKVHDSITADTLSPEAQAYLLKLRDQGDDVNGYVAPGPNGEPVVHLIANNISHTNDFNTLVHEAGVHAGWQGVMGKESFDAEMKRIYDTVKAIESRNGQTNTPYEAAVKEAYNKARSSTPEDAPNKVVIEETLAYLAEADAKLPIVRRIISWLKKHYNRFLGDTFGKIEYNVSDLKALAHAAAKQWMLGDTKFANRVMKERLNRIDDDSSASAAVLSFERAVNEAGYETTEEATPSVGTRVRSALSDPESLKKKALDYYDAFLTNVFSSNAALVNQIRRNLRAEGVPEAEAIGTLLSISDSQTLHSSSLISGFLESGLLEYNNETYKFEIKEDPDGNNFINLAKSIEDAAKAHGISMARMRTLANVAFITRRYKALYEKKAEAVDYLEAGKFTKDRTKKDVVNEINNLNKILGKAGNEVDEGAIWTEETVNKLYDEALLDVPELQKSFDIWDGIRKNMLDFAESTGTLSAESVETLFNNAGYIPFKRDHDFDAMSAHNRLQRLNELSGDIHMKALKGSSTEINDIFKNIEGLVASFMRAGIQNTVASNIAKQAEKHGMARKVDKINDTDQNYDPKKFVEIYDKGNTVIYEVESPQVIKAFEGAESIHDDVTGLAAKFTNFFRKSIVLSPIFSVAQLTQDAISAMTTSGLPVYHALKIPFYTLQEFANVATYRGSKAQRELKAYGAVDRRDWSSAAVQEDLEIFAHLNKEGGFWTNTKDRIMSELEHFSMASDNAVRQAVYRAAQESGESQAVAIEKAFELINFRRRGANRWVSWAANFIPFYNAWLQALNVMHKTLTGEGIGPRASKDFTAYAKMIGTTTALSALYAAALAGDDDYNEMDDYVRRRGLVIPGSGGLIIPLRVDFTLWPKVIAEELYRLYNKEAWTDPANAMQSISDMMIESVMSPTAMPQIVKPILENTLNKSFYTKRDLVGFNLQKLDASEQFNDRTSEMGKWFGNLGISPIKADNFINGYFGSLGAAMMMSSNYLAGAQGKRAMNGFRTESSRLFGRFTDKDFGTGRKSDFYDLYTEVEKAYTTVQRKMQQDPASIEEYFEDERNLRLYSLRDSTYQMWKQLSSLGAQRRQIALNSQIAQADKEAAIEQLNEVERQWLNALPIMELRALGML